MKSICKKFLPPVLAIAIILSVVGAGLAKVAFEGFVLNVKAAGANMLIYEIHGDKATVSGCDKSIAGELEIPENFEGKSVTAIGEEAFSDCAALTSVILPDSVTAIEYKAFSGCSSLKNISLPSGIKRIGFFAFVNCSELNNINLPDDIKFIGMSAFFGTGIHNDEKNWDKGVLYVGNHIVAANPEVVSGDYDIKEGTKTIVLRAFEYCGNLTGITMPDSLRDMSWGTFANCEALEKVRISNNVTSIGYTAFDGCSSLKDITTPDGITSIAEYAFAGCTSLENIKIPACVTDIGWGAFSDCSSLTSIDLPDSLTEIGQEAFIGCSSLKSVKFGNSITAIGGDAFSGCTSLTKAVIPDSVTDIYDGAFQGCSLLEDVTIPDCVTGIGSDAFSETKIYSDESNWEDGVFYIGNHLIAANPAELKGEYNVKASVKTIAGGAFSGCSELTKITLPDDLANIGKYAFNGTGIYNDDSNWEDGVLYLGVHLIAAKPDKVSGSYYIKENTKTIAGGAFHDCKKLTDLFIPKTVSYISPLMFTYHVTVGLETGGESFYYNSLNSITVDDANPNYSDLKGVLFNKDKSRLVFYPGCKKSTRYAIPESVTDVGCFAFAGCKALTEASVPYALANIEHNAFIDCSSLKDIYYDGSEGEWEALSISLGGNNFLLGAKIHYEGDTMPVLLGDIDDDGEITAADARLALRAAVQLETLTADQHTAADVDGEKGVTAADARLILRAAVGLENFTDETKDISETDQTQ